MTAPIPIPTLNFPDGSVLNLTGRWGGPPPPPAAPTTVVGVASAPLDMKAHPNGRTVTLFNKAGDGVNIKAILDVPAGIIPVVCFKDDPTSATVAAQVKQMFDTVQRPYVVVPHHEPEADGPAADYIRRFQATADLRDASAIGKSYALMACKLLLFSELHGAHYQDWISDREDIIGWDCYNPKDATAYPDPDQFLALVLASGAFAGKDVAIFELGSPVVPGDKTGTGYAAWLTAIGKTVQGWRRPIGRFLMAWAKPGANGVDFSMTAPVLKAWQLLEQHQ